MIMVMNMGKSRIYMMTFELMKKYGYCYEQLSHMTDTADELYDLIEKYDMYDALLMADKYSLEELVRDFVKYYYNGPWPERLIYATYDEFDYIAEHAEEEKTYRTTEIALHCYLDKDGFGVGDIDPWIHVESELEREISSDEYHYMNGRVGGSLMDVSTEKLEQYHKEWIGDIEKPKTVKDIFGILPKNTKYKTVSGHKINLGDYYEDYMDTCYIDRLEIDDDKNLTVILLDD